MSETLSKYPGRPLDIFTWEGLVGHAWQSWNMLDDLPELDEVIAGGGISYLSCTLHPDCDMQCECCNAWRMPAPLDGYDYWYEKIEKFLPHTSVLVWSCGEWDVSPSKKVYIGWLEKYPHLKLHMRTNGSLNLDGFPLDRLAYSMEVMITDYPVKHLENIRRIVRECSALVNIVRYPPIVKYIDEIKREIGGGVYSELSYFNFQGIFSPVAISPMYCAPNCDPCGPCEPCGPCSPSCTSPCSPCSPCVPCDPCTCMGPACGPGMPGCVPTCAPDCLPSCTPDCVPSGTNPGNPCSQQPPDNSCSQGPLPCPNPCICMGPVADRPGMPGCPQPQEPGWDPNPPGGGIVPGPQNILPLKQRDPALAGIHNMGRWGCAVRTAQAIAEFALHRELTARQIQEAVASLQANGVLGGSYGMFVNDWNAVMNDAFGRLGRDDMRGIKWGTEQPTFVVREWTFTEGSHFTLHRYSTNVNNRNMIYDSDPNVLANPNRRPTGHNDRPVSIQKRN